MSCHVIAEFLSLFAAVTYLFGECQLFCHGSAFVQPVIGMHNSFGVFMKFVDVHL